MEIPKSRAENLCIAEMCPISFSVSIEEDYFSIDSGYFHSYEKLLFIKNKLEQLLSQKNIKEEIEAINKEIEDKQKFKSLPVQQAVNKSSGYIYFLQDDHNRIKIGKTKKLSERIFNIGLNLPIKPQLFHSIKTDNITKLERHFHSKFKKYRLNGEWFALPYERLTKIRKIEYLRMEQ
jgi:hypothetical protein